MSTVQQTTTTTKPFVPSIWDRLHEPKENYDRAHGSAFSTWINYAIELELSKVHIMSLQVGMHTNASKY